jgi:hypothetical protein
MATRVVGIKKGDGDGNSSNVGDGNSIKGCGHATAMRGQWRRQTAMVWAMATASRVSGNIEGDCDGSKGDGGVTRMAVE